MKLLYQSLIGILLFAFGIAAQTDLPPAAAPSAPRVTGVQSDNPLTNLPWLAVGPGDLLGITVMDCPELSRAFRVADDGTVTLPLLPNKLHVAGLKPPEIEQLIATATKEQRLLVRPSVSVAIMEFRSRPINVVRRGKPSDTIPGNLGHDASGCYFAGARDDKGRGPGNHRNVLSDRSGRGSNSFNPSHSGARAVARYGPSLNIPLIGGEESSSAGSRQSVRCRQRQGSQRSAGSRRYRNDGS